MGACMAQKEVEREIQTTDLMKKQIIDNIETEQLIEIEAKAMYHEVYNRLNKDSQILPVLLSLKTKQNENKPKIDLICVIDVSGSMRGQKIDLVKKTLKYILNLLGDKDRFCMITFNNKAKYLNPFIYSTEQNIAKVENLIDKIEGNCGTTINSGMTLALKTLKQRKIINEATSIFLLSDGQDDDAEKDVYQTFNNIKINQPFSIHTFGFGSDHDAQLMKSITNLKNGNFYYIETLEIVKECFVDALAGLFSVIAENVKLTCKLIKQPIFNDFRINQFYSYLKKNKNIQSQLEELERIIFWNQIFPQSKSNLKKTKNIKIYSLLQDFQSFSNVWTKEVEFQEIGDIKKFKLQKFLELKFYNQDEKFQQIQADKDVSIHYFRVKGAQAMGDAAAKLSEYDYISAQAILDNAILLISQSKYIQDPILQALNDDLKNFLTQCKNFKSKKLYKENSPSYMLSRSIVHMNQQSSPMQINMLQDQNYIQSNNLYSNPLQSQMRIQLINDSN